MKTYFVYILECVNGAYYTGYTTDMERRYREHCEGSEKCKYTRSFPPKRIAACWEMRSETASKAMRLERAIKALPKDLKKNLVANPDDLFFYIDMDKDVTKNVNRAVGCFRNHYGCL